MPRIKSPNNTFRPHTLARIQRADAIIREYHAQGIVLSLRGVYYVFVSRDLFPADWADPKTGSTNNERSYKRLGDLIADGRLAGLIDWDLVVDRARAVRFSPSWDDPRAIVRACANQFRLDRWARQEAYCEVAIEKDALLGVIEAVCQANDLPYTALKGYSSVTQLWEMAYRRFLPRLRQGKRCVLFYLGDHDPSGLDMSRDVEARVNLFAHNAPHKIEVRRLALNHDQVEQYAPPPNPTKVTDSRAAEYVRQFGHECWELDALEPVVIRDLVQAAVDEERDAALWDEALAEEAAAKKHLAGVARNWQTVVAGLPAEEEDGDIPDIFDDL